MIEKLINAGWEEFEDELNEIEEFYASGLDKVRKDYVQENYAKSNRDRLVSIVRRLGLTNEVKVSKRGTIVELRRLDG